MNAASATETPAIGTRPAPTQQEIADRAYHIYMARTAAGRSGSPEEDWYEAVEDLK